MTGAVAAVLRGPLCSMSATNTIMETNTVAVDG